MDQQRVDGSEPQQAQVFYDLVLIAASAGGLKPISQVLACLAVDFGASVVVVLHLAPHHKSQLAEILARSTPLPVKQITGRERILPGMVYIAPPDFHTLIELGGFVGLEQSEPVNFTRPAADPLFASAAACCGRRTIAVVLSGMGHDGSRGLVAIKQAGGIVIAQDQATSEYFGMPGAAIRSGQVDFVLPLERVSQAINQLVQEGRYHV